MNLNSKPVANPDNFYRKEDINSILVVPGSLGPNYSCFVNETGMEILKYCNSKNTLQEIVKKIQKTFNIKNENELIDDIYKFLVDMTKKGVLSSFKGDIMFDGKDILNNKQYRIHHCGEGDIKTICEYMPEISSRKDGKVVILNHKVNKTLIPSVIKALSIRTSLFNFSEEIFLVYNATNNKTTGLISFTNLSNGYISIYDFSLINFNEIYDKNIRKEILNACIKEILNIADYKYKKIRFRCSSKSDEDVILILKDLGLKLVGTLKNEYGENIDELIYENIYI